MEHINNKTIKALSTVGFITDDMIPRGTGYSIAYTDRITITVYIFKYAIYTRGAGNKQRLRMLLPLFRTDTDSDIMQKAITVYDIAVALNNSIEQNPINQ